MGDFLFSFTGRMGRVSYWLALLCTAAIGYGAFLLQQYLAEWQFGMIALSVIAVVPAIIYLSSTTQRFRDRNRHPFIGILLYYIIPAALLFVAMNVLDGAAIIAEMSNHKGSFPFAERLEDPAFLQVAAPAGTAVLLLLIGQCNLFLLPGTKGANAFGDKPKHAFSITHPEPSP